MGSTSVKVYRCSACLGEHEVLGAAGAIGFSFQCPTSGRQVWVSMNESPPNQRVETLGK